mmetsp:Transcript_13371/g.25664  ORF Transcript_13371/g.25664 Transcript_13371/m.25664 type:complete len:625 (+) Transcript_13371:575-2449(+)
MHQFVLSGVVRRRGGGRRGGGVVRRESRPSGAGQGVAHNSLDRGQHGIRPSPHHRALRVRADGGAVRRALRAGRWRGVRRDDGPLRWLMRRRRHPAGASSPPVAHGRPGLRRAGRGGVEARQAGGARVPSSRRVARQLLVRGGRGLLLRQRNVELGPVGVARAHPVLVRLALELAEERLQLERQRGHAVAARLLGHVVARRGRHHAQGLVHLQHPQAVGVLGEHNQTVVVRRAPDAVGQRQRRARLLQHALEVLPQQSLELRPQLRRLARLQEILHVVHAHAAQVLRGGAPDALEQLHLGGLRGRRQLRQDVGGAVAERAQVVHLEHGALDHEAVPRPPVRLLGRGPVHHLHPEAEHLPLRRARLQTHVLVQHPHPRLARHRHHGGVRQGRLEPPRLLLVVRGGGPLVAREGGVRAVRAALLVLAVRAHQAHLQLQPRRRVRLHLARLGVKQPHLHNLSALRAHVVPRRVLLPRILRPRRPALPHPVRRGVGDDGRRLHREGACAARVATRLAQLAHGVVAAQVAALVMPLQLVPLGGNRSRREGPALVPDGADAVGVCARKRGPGVGQLGGRRLGDAAQHVPLPFLGGENVVNCHAHDVRNLAQSHLGAVRHILLQKHLVRYR